MPIINFLNFLIIRNILYFPIILILKQVSLKFFGPLMSFIFTLIYFYIYEYSILSLLMSIHFKNGFIKTFSTVLMNFVFTLICSLMDRWMDGNGQMSNVSLNSNSACINHNCAINIYPSIWSSKNTKLYHHKSLNILLLHLRLFFVLTNHFNSAYIFDNNANKH